jgi:hypothetical protein
VTHVDNVDDGKVYSRPTGGVTLEEGREHLFNKRMAKIATELATLLPEKNRAYGNAVRVVADMLKILYPNGVKPEDYLDFMLIVRDLDKTCRIARGDKTAFGESPWKDKAGYGIYGAAIAEEESL